MRNSNLHFISGLPRSGSTLLSALLVQNPRFRAGVTSPVAMLCASLLQGMSGATEFSSFFDDQRRARMLRGLFETYYEEGSVNGVVFDTNRLWTARLPLVGQLYPNARVVCCVRDIVDILDSCERLFAANPLQTSRLFNFKSPASVYSRVEMLMNEERGLVGHPWLALREGWFGLHADRLIVIQYQSLAQNPQETLRSLYSELSEPYFQHDFENVFLDASQYDAEIGIPGLHRVKPEVAYIRREPCLPPDLMKKYLGVNFWRSEEMNRNRVFMI